MSENQENQEQENQEQNQEILEQVQTNQEQIQETPEQVQIGSSKSNLKYYVAGGCTLAGLGILAAVDYFGTHLILGSDKKPTTEQMIQEKNEIFKSQSSEQQKLNELVNWYKELTADNKLVPAENSTSRDEVKEMIALNKNLGQLVNTIKELPKEKSNNLSTEVLTAMSNEATSYQQKSQEQITNYAMNNIEARLIIIAKNKIDGTAKAYGLRGSELSGKINTDLNKLAEYVHANSKELINIAIDKSYESSKIPVNLTKANKEDVENLFNALRQYALSVGLSKVKDLPKMFEQGILTYGNTKYDAEDFKVFQKKYDVQAYIAFVKKQ